MESQDNAEVEGEEKDFYWRNLESLPPEILLHICSFLSAKFVLRVFSRVCKKFQEIVESDIIWKMRIFRRWPQSYPVVPPLEDLDWKEACIAREEQYHLWSNHQVNMRKYHFLGAHYGSVNVVHLIEDGRICLSGGRDGDLKLWNLDPISLVGQPYNNDHINIYSSLISSRHHANAWVWDIAYNSNEKCIYTAGFDSKINCWNLENSAVPMNTYVLSSPILCLAFHSDQLALGCYGRCVSVFDTRTNDEPIYKHYRHRKPVICIVADDKHVISGSEDNSVVIFDKVAAKVLQRLEFERFPLSMSYGEGQLMVGDVDKAVHVIDPRHDEFCLLHTFNTGHTKKITGVQHSLGSVITCSTDKTIRILEPHVEPGAIAVLESTNEVSRISFCNDILACSNVDDSISVWIPNDMFD